MQQLPGTAAARLRFPDIGAQRVHSGAQQGRNVLELQQCHPRRRQLPGTAVQLAYAIGCSHQSRRLQAALKNIQPAQKGVAVRVQPEQLANTGIGSIHLPAQQSVAGLLGDFRGGRRAQQVVAIAVAFLGGDSLLPQ